VNVWKPFAAILDLCAFGNGVARLGARGAVQTEIRLLVPVRNAVRIGWDGGVLVGELTCGWAGRKKWSRVESAADDGGSEGRCGRKSARHQGYDLVQRVTDLF